MRSRKALRYAQPVRPIAEQRHDRKVAAERQQIPRAVDVRQRFEQPDDADTEHARQSEVAGGSAHRRELD